jgi:proteasome lid subunit RPN8/RPN11
LEIAKQYVDEMVSHALEDDPDECCGILAGPDGKVVKLYRMTNTERSPYRYSMDPKEQISVNREMDDNGWELLAIYHSHTHSAAYPSSTDVRMATWPDGTSIWPDAHYILVSLEDHNNPPVRAFRITDGSVTEEELRVTQE